MSWNALGRWETIWSTSRVWSVSFVTDAGPIKAIDGVDFTIPRKTVVGVVGESGSGKSVTARSIIKLLPETATTWRCDYFAPHRMGPRASMCSP